jgi:hypothetical protein
MMFSLPALGKLCRRPANLGGGAVTRCHQRRHQGLEGNASHEPSAHTAAEGGHRRVIRPAVYVHCTLMAAVQVTNNPRTP